MKNYHKIGNKKPGKPAYRTPATYRIRKDLETKKKLIKRSVGDVVSPGATHFKWQSFS